MTAIAWIQSLFGPYLHPLWLGITYLGSEYAYIVLLALYYWLIDPWTGRQLGMWVGLSYGLNTVLKLLWATPRPFELNPNLATPTAQATAEGSGFPSGHAQGAATFWLYVAWHHDRLWLWLLSVLLVLLITVSRVYLGAHFLIDVGAGLLLGTLFVWLASRLTIPVSPGLWIQVLAVSVTWVVSAFFPPIARSLGVVIGFFLSNPTLRSPTTWKSRWLFGGLGLICVFSLFALSSWLLTPWRDQGWVIYARYLGLTLFATEVWPKLMGQRYFADRPDL